MALKIRSLSLNLPFGLGGMDIDVTEAEARAAWELYVEFSTRVAAHPLAPGAGSVREALDSVYTLFGTTREVLREAGPEAGHGPDSLGPLAIRVLNEGLRPFLVKWHTETRATDTLAADRRAEFDGELETMRLELKQYVGELGRIAGVYEA